MSQKWLYLPIDLKVRELHSKTMLALAAANDGYNVIIGRKKDVAPLVEYYPPGYFLGFGAQENFQKLYKRLKKKGFFVGAMDEEGLVTFSDETYLRLRVSRQTLEQADLFFAWGQHQKALISKQYPELSDKIIPTGNVRMDLLRPEFRHVWAKDVADLQEKYGKYILIVSSFGTCNHFNGREKYLQDLRDKKIIRSPSDEKIYLQYFDLKAQNLDHYQTLIPALAKKYPEHKIILRPHPAEQHALWQEVAKASDNILVVHENNIQPWILGSDLIIHHYCTTALEALIGDVPAIAYRPVENPLVETEFAYAGSLIAKDEETVFTQVNDILASRLQALEQRRQAFSGILNAHISNLTETTAIRGLLNIFNASPVASRGFSLRPFIFQLKRIAKRLLKNREAEAGGYVEHKFPDLTKEEIRLILECAEPGNNLSVTKINDACYLIKR